MSAMAAPRQQDRQIIAGQPIYKMCQ